MVNDLISSAFTPIKLGALAGEIRGILQVISKGALY